MTKKDAIKVAEKNNCKAEYSGNTRTMHIKGGDGHKVQATIKEINRQATRFQAV